MSTTRWEVRDAPREAIESARTFAERLAIPGGEQFSGKENWIEARHQGEIVGVCRWRVLPGGVGVVWPPVVSLLGESGDLLAGDLLTAAVRSVERSDARFALSLIPLDEPKIDRWMERAGFVPLTIRVDLVWEACDLPCVEPDAILDFEMLSPDNEHRFQKVIEQTWEGSLDLQPDEHSRDLNKVLATYRDGGLLRPDHWLIAKSNGRDAGCVIVTDDPSDGYCELTYLGLIPEFRGRRWGRILVRKSQRLAREAGRSSLHVAVVSRNEPARRTYGAAGFGEIARRKVMVRGRGMKDQ